MAVRNIMVIFSTNVGQFARDMTAAAAATQTVERAGQRLAIAEQQQSLAMQKYALQQNVSATRSAEIQAAQAEKAQELSNLETTIGRQRTSLLGHEAQGHDTTALQARIKETEQSIEANKAEAASLEQSAQRDAIALQQKNLAAQQSSYAVINSAKAEEEALKAQDAQRLQTIGKIAKTATLVGAAGIAAIAGTVDVAAKFQAEMAQAAAISDVTRTHLEQMSDAILRIGAVTPVSLSQLTQGLVSAEQAGFQGAEAIGLVKLGAEGAVIGMTDASSAIKTVTTVLTSFSLGINQATNVNNILIAAVQHGLGTYSGFAEALNIAGTSAKASGVSINEVAAAVAVMSRKGIDAVTAGTGIARILVQMQRLGTPAERALTDLANSTGKYSFANGEAVIRGLHLAGTLKLIGQATGESLTKIEQFVPNIRQIRAALALFSNDGRDVANMLTLFNNPLQLAINSAKAYATQLNTTQAQFQLFKNNLNETGIVIGQTFLPIANGILKWLTGLTEDFQNLSPWAQHFIEIVVGLGSALLLAGGIIGIFYSSIGHIITAIKGLGDVFAGSNAKEIKSTEDVIAAQQENIASLREQMAMIQGRLGLSDGIVTTQAAETGAWDEDTLAIQRNTLARQINNGTPITPGGIGAGGVGTVASTEPIAGPPLPPVVGPPAPAGLGESLVPAETMGGAGLLARGAGAINGAPLLTAGIGLAAGYGAFQLQHHLSGGGARAANIFGNVATGAGLGATIGLAGGPLEPITSTAGALIGGGIGLVHGLFNLAEGSKNRGPDATVKAYQDAISQEQSGVTGSTQQQFFNDLAQKNVIDNFGKIKVNLADVNAAILGGIKDTKDAATVQKEWSDSLGLTDGSLTKLGFSQKKTSDLQNDVKKALTGDVDAAKRVESAYKDANAAAEYFGEGTRKVTSQQLISASTLKVVSQEIKDHKDAVDANAKAQKDLLPITQANNLAMTLMGTNADGTAVDLSKLPPEVKAIADAFSSMIDPAKAFTDAVQNPINIALQGTATFASFSDVFSQAQSEAQSTLDAQAQKAAKATNDQIAAANAQRSFQTAVNNRAIAENARLTNAIIGGNKLQSIQIRAGALAAEAAGRQQVAALNRVADGSKVTAKEIKDSWGNGGVAQLSLSQFSSALTQTVAEQSQWNADLVTIANRAKEANIPVGDLLAGLEKAGRAGEAVTHSLATGPIGDIGRLSAQSTALAHSATPVLSADEFKSTLEDHLKQAEQFKSDLQKVMIASGGDLSVAQLFLKSKDDAGARAALHNLADNLTPAAIASFKHLADEATNGFDQAAAVKFDKTAKLIANAINSLKDNPDLKKAGGLNKFFTDVASASGYSNVQDAKAALAPYIKNILESSTTTGLGVGFFKKLFGADAVNQALKSDHGLQAAIDKGVKDKLAAPFQAKITADTSAARSAWQTFLDDIKTHQPKSVSDKDLQAFREKQAQLKAAQRDLTDLPTATIKVNAPQDLQAVEDAKKKLAKDREDIAHPWVIQADMRNLNKAMKQVEEDKRELLSGKIPQFIIRADRTAVDKALAQLHKDEKDPRVRREKITADTAAWDKAKKKLMDDTDAFHKAINKPNNPKIVLDGLQRFRSASDEILRDKKKWGGTVTITVTGGPAPYTVPPPPAGAKAGHYVPTFGGRGGGGWKWVTNADGGFVNFADGGHLSRLPAMAKIQKAGTLVQWAEPETGGEAFIPMGMSKRAQSLTVLQEVARHFGMGLTRYADGGFTRPPGVAMLGQRQMTAAEPRVIIVNQKIPVSQTSHYQFGDISGPSMADVQRYADSKSRLRALRGGI